MPKVVDLALKVEAKLAWQSLRNQIQRHAYSEPLPFKMSNTFPQQS